MKYYDDDFYEEEKPIKQAWRPTIQEIGCGYCYDNRTKKDIEIYFFDRANNMRICDYCPSCGRQLR